MCRVVWDGGGLQTEPLDSDRDKEFGRLADLFDLYLETSGYLAVVKEYLETRSRERCREKLEDVIHLFCAESIRYFDDILDSAVYDNIFCSVSRILLRGKKGLDADNFNESLQKLVTQDYNSNISKAVCNRAMMWLQSAGILDFAGKITECCMKITYSLNSGAGWSA